MAFAFFFFIFLQEESWPGAGPGHLDAAAEVSMGWPVDCSRAKKAGTQRDGQGEDESASVPGSLSPSLDEWDCPNSRGGAAR